MLLVVVLEEVVVLSVVWCDGRGYTAVVRVRVLFQCRW
jgi:hypothetical protein